MSLALTAGADFAANPETAFNQTEPEIAALGLPDFQGFEHTKRFGWPAAQRRCVR